jgi:hypothetical protein
MCDCNELLIFLADVKNGDTVANPLFPVSFDLTEVAKKDSRPVSGV